MFSLNRIIIIITTVIVVTITICFLIMLPFTREDKYFIASILKSFYGFEMYS